MNVFIQKDFEIFWFTKSFFFPLHKGAQGKQTLKNIPLPPHPYLCKVKVMSRTLSPTFHTHHKSAVRIGR